MIPPYKNQLPGSQHNRWSKNVESIRKDVECTFGILKKRFLILKNPIQHHFPEKIEAIFNTCCAIHNWLHDHDTWDDWEERGMVSVDDVTVEYNIFDQNNRCYGKNSQYYGFSDNTTRSQMRELRPSTFFNDDDFINDPVASQWEAFEKRRCSLIRHYIMMTKNHTINTNLC